MVDEAAPETQAAPPRRRIGSWWVVLIVIALVFVAIGLRQQSVRVFSIEQDTDELAYFAVVDACREQTQLTVTETAERVTLTAQRNRSFCAGQTVCSAMVPFRLADPLGDREVVDGSRDTPIEVTPAPE